MVVIFPYLNCKYSPNLYGLNVQTFFIVTHSTLHGNDYENPSTVYPTIVIKQNNIIFNMMPLMLTKQTPIL